MKWARRRMKKNEAWKNFFFILFYLRKKKYLSLKIFKFEKPKWSFRSYLNYIYRSDFSKILLTYQNSDRWRHIRYFDSLYMVQFSSNQYRYKKPRGIVIIRFCSYLPVHLQYLMKYPSGKSAVSTSSSKILIIYSTTISYPK